MNAKELREAAERVMDYDACSDNDIDTLAEHILSTVREDDDELVSEEWASSFDDLFTKAKYNDGFTTIVHVDRQLKIASVTSNKVKTRRQFRRLCEGLGIQLKETT